MLQLKWSQNKAGTLNGKVRHITLFTVAYYLERWYFVAPKLFGLNKTIPVNPEEAGKREADTLSTVLLIPDGSGMVSRTWIPEANESKSSFLEEGSLLSF